MTPTVNQPKPCMSGKPLGIRLGLLSVSAPGKIDPNGSSSRGVRVIGPQRLAAISSRLE